jgi:hypothetical protein
MLWKQNTQYGQAHFVAIVNIGRVHGNRQCAAPPGVLLRLNLAVCPKRQPALLGAAPKCLTQSPCRAARPLAVSVRFCAVASHHTSIPRSRLRRHLLAARTVCATVEETYCKRPTNNQAGCTVNTSLNFRHGFSAFSGVQPGLCLTGRSRGTSMLRMAAP